MRDHGEGDRTVNRLTWRIGLSLVLFLLLWGAYQMGWIEPGSGPVRVPVSELGSPISQPVSIPKIKPYRKNGNE